MIPLKALKSYKMMCVIIPDVTFSQFVELTWRNHGSNIKPDDDID